MGRYLDLLQQANQRVNLTRINDRAAAEVQHVGDALTLLPYLPAGQFRLIDVGSGGGVPGILLAIARPDARVFLLEATKKKAAYLREFALALSLSNVSILDDRAEDAGHVPRLRESFDIATARAVAQLAWLAEWCLPFVRVGGTVLAMKGERITDELPAAKTAVHMLGGGKPVVHPVTLPGSTHRVIVAIPKTRPTEERFPPPRHQRQGKAAGLNRPGGTDKNRPIHLTNQLR